MGHFLHQAGLDLRIAAHGFIEEVICKSAFVREAVENVEQYGSPVGHWQLQDCFGDC